MRRIIAASIMTIMTTVWLSSPTAWADSAIQGEMKQDVLLRALVDELERGKVGLKLEDLARPYFIEYALQDSTYASVSADLGAVTHRDTNRSRTLRADVRVGSYELDNTNFSGDYGGSYFGGMYGGGGGASMPIEDDYNAIRQAIWWATDREYQDVVETFEKKKAFMESKMIEDKPDDFSREAPAVCFEQRIEPEIDIDRLERLVVTLSDIFRKYPGIQDSGVGITGAGGSKYLVNSEGTRIRVSRMRFSLSINATVQADDGMELSDSISVHALSPDQIPSLDELKERTHKMIDGLIALKDAPVLESYTGPVLFEAKPATALFASRFAGSFAGGQRPVGSSTGPDDFENKIDKRILPGFITVVDDPTQEMIAGQPVLGHYEYDDQGVKAQPVTLVEDGRLMAQVMSRNPSKKFKRSTGHGRGSYGPSTATSCLIVTTDDESDAESLKDQLLEAVEDEDLEFGVRVASLGTTGGGEGASPFMGGRGRGGANPLEMYKVYPDGREELVRGAEIASLNLKAFKRMLAVGDTPFVLNTAGRTGKTVVAPAMLFEELDLAKIDRDFDKPPILPTPLARERK